MLEVFLSFHCWWVTPWNKHYWCIRRGARSAFKRVRRKIIFRAIGRKSALRQSSQLTFKRGSWHNDALNAYKKNIVRSIFNSIYTSQRRLPWSGQKLERIWHTHTEIDLFWPHIISIRNTLLVSAPVHQNKIRNKRMTKQRREGGEEKNIACKRIPHH